LLLDFFSNVGRYKNVFVYGILDLFDFAKRVQKKALCLEIAEEVLHAGIVQTGSFPGYSGP
ncbi:hypothetical protein, partial [Bacillus smithii]|uniref:hypothetical protein n=1 Tax=Bacillus smithii TaxID=1479 RepID=UPI003D1B9153